MPVVPALEYTPPPGYELDVEIYRGAELRRRAAHDHVARLERMNFYVLLYVTRAGYLHMVDFESYRCRPGSLVIIQPGQVHRFGDLTRFYGWFLIFRSEVLSPDTGQVPLPTHVRFAAEHRRAFEETLNRIAHDTEGGRATPGLQALVHSEVHSFMLRVQVSMPAPHHRHRAPRAVVERFVQYRAAVDREHRRWHDVARYARHLGCSAKSLARASREVAGLSAKEILTARRVLEAKRLLAHTLMPVAEISDDLGFSEPTNFVKLFRRETGRTPLAFRRAHPR